MWRFGRLGFGVLVRGAVLSVAALCLVSPEALALPDGRGYELVSPPEKHGTGVVSDSVRTRAATEGNAVGFISLGAFADAAGTGVATDYVSARTSAPGTSGWTTHAITPLQSGTTFDGLLNALEPLYVGEFTADLSQGVFFAQSRLTEDTTTAAVPNLYRRSDLRNAGKGTYELITECPLCDQSAEPLPAARNPLQAGAMRPILAWMAPDARRVAFESGLRLTADTPAFLNRVEVYEWDNGAVTLAGRVPSSGAACNDINGPHCVGSVISVAGRGAVNLTRTPHVLSDGSDGHSRLFFTYPTADGVTPGQVGDEAGKVFMRVDGTSTVQLNVSERGTADAFAPAKFLDASADGERAFFMTTQALTDDAPVDGERKIYMYDATQPPAAPNHLTLINTDHEPADTTQSSADGIVGLSADGHYVYFIASGQLVSGQPLPEPNPGLYLWHDGSLAYIGPFLGADENDVLSTGPNFVFHIAQQRVTPDGRSLLYRSAISGTEQLYLYRAGSDSGPVCVSCDPAAADVTGATVGIQVDIGGTGGTWHESHALADDGAKVFFSTAEALVPEDVNGRTDAYEYDVPTGTVHLISTGTSPNDSWFMDASTSGSDVFFTTRQQLVGWDRDQEYDLYDARIGGGFPAPSPGASPCAGDACQGVLANSPSAPPVGSNAFSGAGNEQGKLKPRVKRCRRGFVHKRVRGRLRCVKRLRKRGSGRRSNLRGSRMTRGRKA